MINNICVPWPIAKLFLDDTQKQLHSSNFTAEKWHLLRDTE